MSEERSKNFFKTPDIEDAEIFEGDFIDKDIRTQYDKETKTFVNKVSNKIHISKSTNIDEDTQEKVKPIMNKASKLL